MKIIVKKFKDFKNEIINNDKILKDIFNSYYNNKKSNYNNQIPIHSESVDIIICVHNAYIDVKNCIESVFKNTKEPYKIIIIDDGSSEETENYLIKIYENNKNVKLFRNNNPKGYTYAANIGLKESNADYRILLNSDTIVTDGWLDKMIECQKSNEKIGIVGPLSNFATWQSVPVVFNKKNKWNKNKIPYKMNLDLYAKMIESSSSRIYPELPLLNGFCLLIYKEVVNKIGYLDEENFGSGYSEEDDYNLRAGKAGFKLAVADDTFIYHVGTKSYSNKRKILLCKENSKKLLDKHGDKLISEKINILLYNYQLDYIRKKIRYNSNFNYINFPLVKQIVLRYNELMNIILENNYILREIQKNICTPHPPRE